MAERTVIYRLKVLEDDQNKSVINKWSTDFLKAEREMVAKRRQIRVGAIKELEEAEKRLASAMSSTHERTLRSMATSSERALKRITDSSLRASKAMEDGYRKSLNAIESLDSRMTVGISSRSKARAKEAENDTNRALREAEKRKQALEIESRKAADELGRQRSKLVELDKKYAEAGKSIQGEIEGWTGAVTQFGRGIAGLGILSQNSTEKIVKGLVVAQGVFDTLNGGVKTYLMLNTSMQRVLEMRRIQEERVAAQHAVNTAAIQAETAATNALAASRSRASIGAGVGAIGAGGSAVSSAVGNAASAGAGAVGAGAVGSSAAVTATASTLAGTFAVLAGAGASLAAAFEFATEAVNTGGVGKGARVGSFTDWAGGASWNPFGWAIAGDARMQERSTAKQARRTGLRGEIQGITRDTRAGIALINAQSRLGSLQNMMEMLAPGQGASLEEQRMRNASQLSILRQSSGNVASTGLRGGPGNEAAVAKMRLAMGQQEVALLNEQLSINQQIGEEKLRNAKEGLALAKQALEIAKQELAVDEEKLMTAKERFGQLSDFEQQRLIDIKRRADAGESLSREERSLLRGVGTEGATAIARSGDLAAANAAGFDKFFGATERTRIAEQKRVIEERLQVELQQAAEVEVTVKQDNEKIFQEVRRAIRESQVNLQPIIERIAQDETEKAILALREEMDRRQAAFNSQFPSGGR